MPILMKDEKKYTDCVDVLDKLEEWTHQIYSAAGLCNVPNQMNEQNTLSIGNQSRPDQPASHIPPVASNDDPLSGVKVPCFGDQLTRVRLAGAKDLRRGCHSARERLDHLYPFCIVDWHTKRSFLKTIFQRLYKNSGREKGTLRYFREKLNRRNVTLDVKHFEDCEQLFLSVGRCYVVEALSEFFQIDDPSQRPTKNAPNMAFTITPVQKKEYMVNVLDKFLDQYIFVNDHDDGDDDGDEDGDDNEDSPFGSDGVCHYSVNMIKSYMILADIKDAVATGNGQHLSSLHKQLLRHFFSATGFNEYAIEMLVSIMQREILLSPAEAHQCTWAATVNWSGGEGKNVEIDLFQENRNKDMKSMVKSMGANKTDKAIHRSSKASGGTKKIVEAFNKQIRKPRKASSHTHKSSIQDESTIIADLRSLRPFKQVNGRQFESFKDISHDPTALFDEEKFEEWVNRHKNNILKQFPQEIDTDSDNDSDFDITDSEII